MILDTKALLAFVDGGAGVGEQLRDQSRAAIPVIVLGESTPCQNSSDGIGNKERDARMHWRDARPQTLQRHERSQSNFN